MTEDRGPGLCCRCCHSIVIEKINRTNQTNNTDVGREGAVTGYFIFLLELGG